MGVSVSAWVEVEVGFCCCSYLVHVQDAVRHDAVVQAARHFFGGDVLAIVDGEADVGELGRVDLAVVDLAVLLRDEADEMGPLRGHGEESSLVEEGRGVSGGAEEELEPLIEGEGNGH